MINVAVLHVSAKWRTAHHLAKGKSRMFELINKFSGETASSWDAATTASGVSQTLSGMLLVSPPAPSGCDTL